MFWTTVIFLLILGLLVFVHELGHFLVARRNGVKVEEFAFGFRPQLWATKRGETTYAINLIPLGGYVKLYGETDQQGGPRSLRSKSVWQRFQILVAGSAMNFLLGIAVLTVLFVVGFSPIFPGVGANPLVTTKQEVLVKAVNPGSPAAIAGLVEGDILRSVNGQSIATDQDFIVATRSQKGQEIVIDYLRGGQEATVALTPRVEPPIGEGPVGAVIATAGEVRTDFWKAPTAAAWESGRIVGLSAVSFGQFVKNLVIKQEVSDDVTGLIGIGQLTGVTRRLGADYLFQLVAIVSLGLGIVNLMPILPLDGGHIAALGYEKAAGRPLSERQLGTLATAGLLFVLLAFVVVTYKDIIRFNVFDRLF
ncbi:MAG: M50 family metallopeptidase [Patescibacteria group bacterium]